jgi:hypothetical protein
MKLVNPLNYPLAILVASICLVLGVRIIKIPSLVMLPVATAVALGGASFLASQEAEKFNLENPALEQELNNAKHQAQLLINKAESLRSEAQKLLQDYEQINLLTTVQYTCDRTLELPEKIEQLSQKLHGGDSLLSVQELTEQLSEVQRKKNASSGIARQQLAQLENSLKNNINLAQQGQDARQAQVFSLVNIITESAGILQNLQNKLRTADLGNSEQIQELQNLSEELNNFQDNVNFLV